MIKIRGLVFRRQYKRPTIETLSGSIVSHWALCTEADRLKRIISEEAKNPEKAEIARKIKEKKTRVFEHGQTRIFVRNVSQEELDAIKRANAVGVKTEIPFSFELLNLNKNILAPMAFFDLGIDISRYFKELSNFERQKLLRNIARAIGKMHCTSVEHGNITLKNIFLDEKGGIVFGDFSLARIKDVDFSSAESIFSCFMRDYWSIIMRSKIRVYSQDFWDSIFVTLTTDYPIELKTREELNKKIKDALDYFWRTNDIHIDLII